MRIRRGISIRWIIGGVILASTVVVLGIGFWLTARESVDAFRRDLVDGLAQVTVVAGDYSVSDLAFGTREESARTLEALQGNPHVEAVALYDVHGDLFSKYERPGAELRRVPVRVEPGVGDLSRLEAGFVEVFHPLAQKGERFGTIYLRGSTAALDQRIRDYLAAMAALAAGLVGLSVAFAIVFQRVVSQPILALFDATERVSATEDWATRLDEAGAREVRALTRSFNRLLRVIQQRQAQRDIAEEAQRRFAERLAVLREIDQAILAGCPRAEIARRSLEGLATQVLFVASAVEADGPDGRTTALLATLPGPGAGVAPAAPEPVLADDALARRLGSGERVEVDLSGDVTGLRPGLRFVAARGARRALLVPLEAEGQVLGCLTLGLHGSDVMTGDLETLLEVAALLAVAIRLDRMSSEIASHTADLERRVSERTVQLEASNRELEAFGYSIAHDLRAPLRSVSTFAGALQEDYPDALDDVGRDLLRRIVAASVRMDFLIRDLLEYSRVSAKQVELSPVDLGRVVGDVRVQLAGMLTERVAEVIVDEPLGSVRGHFGTLAQVIGNLVSNAAKFVAPGAAPRVRVRSEARGSVVRLWVEDNGIGIAPQYHERIFRLFERLHGSDAYPGTGVGLAIVKRGVERMGGKAGLESEPGQGARFWIELPGVG